MELFLVIILTALMIPVAVVTTGVLRIILAIPFLIFFPGYALTAALFPKKDSLDTIARLAFSLMMSIAMVALVGVILNYTPWEIRPYPLIGVISGLIFICSLVALLRRRRLPKEERFEPRIYLSFPRLGGGNRIDLALSIALCLAVLGAAGTLAYVIATPKHVEKFSEFYVLGPEGKLEDYPQEAIVYHPVEVTLGIINREHADTTYNIEIAIDGDITAKLDTVQLPNGGKWERKVSVVPKVVGQDQRVEFLLYKNQSRQPYLTLHLTLNVRGEE